MNEIIIPKQQEISQEFDTGILAGTRSAHTISQYKLNFNEYMIFAGSRELAIIPSTLARWRQSLFENGYTHAGKKYKYSVAAINQRLASVRSIMYEAAQQGFIPHETAERFRGVKGLKLVANKDRQKIGARTLLSREDVINLINSPDTTTAVGKMHRALITTLATVGMRVSEALDLKYADIRFETTPSGEGWVCYVLGKNMETPEARPMSRQAKQAIDEWLKARSFLGVDSEFIFTSFGGRGGRDPSSQPMARESAYSMVDRYATGLGLENVKPHDLRRYVGTQLAKKDIRLAQKQLGHQSIETTARHYVLDAVAVGSTDNLID